MRKLFVSLALSIGAVMIATSAVGALSSPSTGSARLHPYDQSGIKARIDFVDTHNELTGLLITGTATGLDPDKIYVSLIYDNAAVPGGPRACQPGNDTLDEEQMGLGRWIVNPDGTGTLVSVNAEGAYVPLSEFDTVSIIELTVIGRPDLSRVVACGQVSKHK
jgi:hypothetical protein